MVAMHPMQRVLDELGWSEPALDFSLHEQEPVDVKVSKPDSDRLNREQSVWAEREALKKTLHRGGPDPGNSHARLARHHWEQRRAQELQDALLRRAMPSRQPEPGPPPEGPEYLREITLHLSANGAEAFKRKVPTIRDAARGAPGLKSLRFDEYRPGHTGRWFKATVAYTSERARDMAPQHNFHVLLDKYVADLGPQLLTRYENDLEESH